MAYFSNGTEGMRYEEQWCDRCVHQEPGCMVWMLHMMHNYEECGNKRSMLHELIPRRLDGFAGECTMFYEAAREVAPLRAAEERDRP